MKQHEIDILIKKIKIQLAQESIITKEEQVITKPIKGLCSLIYKILLIKLM